MYCRLAPSGAVRLNEFYVSQYLDHSPLSPPKHGVLVAMPFPHTDDDPETRARRAVAVGFGSIAPNTVVAGVDHDAGLLLVHQLEPTRKPSDIDPLGLR